MKKSSSISAFLSSDIGILVGIALLRVVLQIPTNGQYGFHQDELVTLDAAAHHLAWGYVAWPPVTPFLGRVALALFGLSPIGLRLFVVLAEGGVLLLAGLMVRDLGGSRWAQILAAVAVGTTPNSIIQGGLFQYETFDYFFWVLLAFSVVRLLKTENARWWLAIGATIGLGMMTKYTIAFFAAGLIVGVLVTRNRRYLRSRWLWGGALLALLIWLPNLVWEFQHHWITLDFLASIHGRDMREGQGASFLPDQILFNLNPVMLLLVIAGLAAFLFGKDWRRYRVLGWMYVVPFALLLAAQGNGYYLASAYPMLAAGGAVWWEQRLARAANQGGVRTWLGRAARPATWGVLSVVSLFLIAVTLPVAPLGSAWWKVVSKSNVQLLSEVGWPQLAQQVAAVYNALPASEKAHAGIMASSAGEIGSIDMYGPAYGLPQVISGFDTYWFYGYPNPPPQTLVVVGFSPDFLSEFQDCTLIAPIRVPFNVQNEEAVDHNSIYVCHNLRDPWPEFWAHFQWFG
jgi:hypothetical protein